MGGGRRPIVTWGLARGGGCVLVLGVVLVAIACLFREDARAPVRAPVEPRRAPASTAGPRVELLPPVPELAPVHAGAASIPPRTPVATAVAPVRRERGGEAAGEAGTARRVRRARPRDAVHDEGPRLALWLKDSLGRAVTRALVTSRTDHERRLPARRSGWGGKLKLDPLEPDERNVRVTVRHARFGKQGPFALGASASETVLELADVRRGVLEGTIVVGVGPAPARPVLLVVDPDGLSTELGGTDLAVWDPASGAFRTDLVPGVYRVRAQGNGFCPSPWQEVRVGLSGVARVEPLALAREARVVGTVVIESLLDRPVVAFEIESAGPGGELRTEVRRGQLRENGAFVLEGIVPDWHRVRAGDATHEGPWTTFQASEGQVVADVKLLTCPAVRPPALQGEVTDPEGEPLEGVTVVATHAHVETNDRGFFQVRDAAGVRDLVLEKEGFARRVVELDPAASSASLEIRLEPLD